MSISANVLAANQQLRVLRKQIADCHPTTTSFNNNDEEPLLKNELLSSLPAHLGWGSAALTAVFPTVTVQNPQSIPQTYQPEVSKSPRSTSQERTIKHYPSLGVGALQQKMVPHYQLWLACRWLDHTGKGWLSLSEIRAAFSGEAAQLPLFGWRRIRQIIQKGNGLFWTKGKSSQKLWLFSTGRIARLLKVEKLTGLPVVFPQTILSEGIGHFKAHLYAAWHSGRRDKKPISRQTLRQLTQVPERTQRDYEKETKVSVQPNLAIGEKYTAVSLQNHAWERGGALFKFTDWNGRIGLKKESYHAWQMPNSYSGPHQNAPLGRQKRVNIQLTDLVHKGAQGNGEPNIERLYFDMGKDAAEAINKQKSHRAYWPTQKGATHHFWHLFF